MNNISVVTVTYNNSLGLKETLNSISLLKKKPKEVIVIDGASTDNTSSIIKDYKALIDIIFISERDNGIYDAMNKGQKLASGDFIHYLNAGDTISGDPYSNITQECRFPVDVYSEDGVYLGRESFVILGLSYNHQGIIFKKEHILYDTNYRIAADFNLIIKNFKNGIKKVPLNENANVSYSYGGVSSSRRFSRDAEVAKIIYLNKGIFLSVAFSLYALLKLFIPRNIRRILKKNI